MTGMRVLIVEDELRMAGLIRPWARRRGAGGPPTSPATVRMPCGWRIAEYDAIVLDVMLPGISGFETCRRLGRAMSGCRC